MLNQIKTSNASSASGQVQDLLLSCHNKIRHFSNLAVRLSHAQDREEREIAQAADGLFRYFTVALPLHEADENLSIHPRLKQAAPPGELAGPAADAMVDQHMAIDELVERLVPLWKILQAEPEKLDELSGEMCATSKRLAEIFETHLKMEEETIFPALSRFLKNDELAAIVREMQERRRSG